MGKPQLKTCWLLLLFHSYSTFVPPRVRVRATVKLSAAFCHDESSITKGGNENAIALTEKGL